MRRTPQIRSQTRADSSPGGNMQVPILTLQGTFTDSNYAPITKACYRTGEFQRIYDYEIKDGNLVLNQPTLEHNWEREEYTFNKQENYACDE
ncbi:MAG: hypothetical protein M3Q97_09500 [Bacteroidota bacterium]|nr:hypothetical protein [Bacteroidota bacterium]